jgi:hypothetical protein
MTSPASPGAKTVEFATTEDSKKLGGLPYPASWAKVADTKFTKRGLPVVL